MGHLTLMTSPSLTPLAALGPSCWVHCPDLGLLPVIHYEEVLSPCLWPPHWPTISDAVFLGLSVIYPLLLLLLLLSTLM